MDYQTFNYFNQAVKKTLNHKASWKS